MLEPVLPASPAPGTCSPCLARLGDQKGLEVCLKMKPLWASVFMMLAMFLQSSAERAQRCWVRATIPPGLSPKPHRQGCAWSCTVPRVPKEVLCPHQSKHSVPSASQWCWVSPLLSSTGHLHPSTAPRCAGMDPCPGLGGLPGCRGLTQQLSTSQPLAHRSPSPQRDGEEKWTKGETRGLR